MTPEETAFLDTLRRLCADKIAPLAAETDETASFVHRQLAVLAEAGVMGANLPDPYGPGISAACLYQMVEIIAGACASTASALTAHFLATDSILLGGDDTLKARLLPAAAEGRALGAFALTERNAGSDPADMKTRATRQGDAYHLKGGKCFISNGGVADFLVVYAVTDPAAGHRGISAFVVEKQWTGLTIGRAERTMGLRGGHVWELDFDGLIPASNLIGPEGSGFKTAMKVLDNGRVEVAAMATGIAQAALSLATDWCKTRVIGGDALAARQGIRWQLADMATDLAASRALAAAATALRDQHIRFSMQASMAKLHASEMVGRVTDAALQLHGGYGFTRDFPLERLARDCRIFRIYEGSSEIQRNIIAAQLLA
jgi:alkylation response protein AidB-like acyl-CoA dehydrogenase